jgi:hypothetical protein
VTILSVSLLPLLYQYIQGKFKKLSFYFIFISQDFSQHLIIACFKYSKKYIKILELSK